VQARGYNALSFRELAKEVGIKSASVHYYFPTKGDLGAALAKRYAEDAVAYLQKLQASKGDLTERMRAYTAIFRAALANDNRMCLYGIMAAERADLPLEVRTEVDRFVEVNIQWLTEQLAGPKSGGRKSEQKRALAIFAAIEGAQLVAHGRADITAYDQAIEAYRAAGLIP
jgi:TetR/AcrR family transcriptional regulator, transcriptional repressor for nem operon